MNVVFIVPTGIGATIGGHAGDATPAAKLIASICDKLLVHPNVVNASDINEMTENMLYVEGSILDKFLEGRIGLKESCGNKMLLVTNEIRAATVNAVSAARVTMGADIKICKLDTPLRMVATMVEGKATGDIHGLDEVVQQVREHDFDVLVVNTPIETDPEKVKDYLREDDGVNLWGGVEAKLSRLMSDVLRKPVIHAPVENSEIFKTFDEVIDPRKAAEMVSVCYLHCCLKGGHVAPKMTKSDRALWNTDIDFLVTPADVYGAPHIACMQNGIPVIAVEENRTVLQDRTPRKFIRVKNYFEAVGVIAAKKAGVTLNSVRRPLQPTKICGEC